MKRLIGVDWFEMMKQEETHEYSKWLKILFQILKVFQSIKCLFRENTALNYATRTTFSFFLLPFLDSSSTFPLGRIEEKKESRTKCVQIKKV
ncbi:hypothetical protein BpHYR1_028781 [Brachionus plicatilis]|uniref:Uncharacterized protein n=1 Tax=Brachionus plicatilis TaxID=10195 RepID=A0A3M7RS91_BRAPC|nr:hypothetical protein BpHYR1_028781 [Brachionus plicatilis]